MSFRYFFYGFLVLGSSLVGAEMSKNALQIFDKKLSPLLKTYCIKCHGEEKQKGKFRIDTLSNDLYNPQYNETWHDILDLINSGEMPPEDEEQPTLTELETMTDWMRVELKKVAHFKKGQFGTPSSRLTKYEYQNTMKDLIGIDLNYATDLPPESISEEGFKNNASSMQISPLQMEFYLNAARKAMNKAIVKGAQPKAMVHTVTKPDDTHQRRKVTKTQTLLPGETFGVCMEEHPTSGPFQISIKAKPKFVKGHGAPRLRVTLGYRPDVSITEKAVSNDFDLVGEDTYTFTGYLEEFPMPSKEGKYPGLLISVQNVYDDGHLSFKAPKKKSENKNNKKGGGQEFNVPAPKIIAPEITIEQVTFTSPYYVSWPPQHHLDILPAFKNIKTHETDYIKSVLSKFISKAYRRPAQNNDIEWLLSYYKKLRKDYSLEKSAREVLAIALVSPNFLYRINDSPNTDHALASRLSYFLWSSMPDKVLFDLADAGKLKQKQTLKNQVSRLLDHPNAWNFIENFSSQWLDLDGVNRVAVNPQYYPKFDATLKNDMREESLQFFATILKQDLSALNFLDSNFMVINNRLSRHYGESTGTLNGNYEKVNLSKTSKRGGLLSQGSMLLSSSTGMESAPIKRAVWVREKLLHDPPAPPPPDVPSIDAADPNFQMLTAKEQFKAHREVQACILCHKGIDPWGIALEDFDGIGLPRTETKRKVGKKMVSISIDAETTLPGGVNVNGLQELKQYLLDHKSEAFAHALTHKMLTYSLGRNLDLLDEEALPEIAAAFIRSNYKLKTLIEKIVLSDLFSSPRQVN